MFFKLLQFEWEYHSKQTSFIVFFLLFPGYGILSITAAFQYLEISTMYNDAYNLSFLSGIISIGSMFSCIYFSINGTLRDVTYQTEELIFSTGIKKRIYYITRFLGIFLITLLQGTIALCGVYIGTLIADLDPDSLHVFDPSHYVWPWLTILLPNVFVTTSILVLVTLTSKKTVFTYITGILMLTIHWICGIYINSPLIGGSSLSSQEVLNVASLIGPIGLAAFFEQTQFLTPIEKNNLLVSLTGNFSWNRIIWITFGIVLFFVSYRLFSFRTILPRRAKKQLQIQENVKSNIIYTPIKISLNSYKTKVNTLISLIKLDTKMMFKGIPFMIMILLWITTLLLTFHNSINSSEIYGKRYPTTDLFLGLITEVFPIFGLLLITFYSGELIWKSRQHKFHKIIGATPVKNNTFYISKIISLSIITSILIVVTILTGVLFQMFNGYHHFQLGLYFSLFYYSGIQILLYIIFTLFIQIIVSNKYLGMILSGGILLLFNVMSSSIGVEHPLLLFNKLPDMARAYSSFNGYGQFSHKFNILVLYWLSFSGVLIVLSIKLWKRGIIIRFSKKMKQAFCLKEKLQLIGLISLFLSFGGYAYYNINIVNEYITNDEEFDFNEQYERAYKKYHHLAVPQLVSIKTEVDIYPHQQKYTVKASNNIANTSTRPMHQIFVTAPKPLQSITIQNSTQVFHDSILNTYLFKLNTPLLAGQKLKMEYNLTEEIEGFEIDNTITNNGTYIKNHHYSPYLGYVNEYEIEDTYEREKRGLPIRTDPVINDIHLKSRGKFNHENVYFETIVSTTKDQTVVTSGKLIKDWKTKNRNYYHYKSLSKINAMISYHSARYKTKTVNHEGVEIEMYYHPDHYQNVTEIIKVTKATIDYCNKNFGTYPHKYLRIAEMSKFTGANGQAMPGVISINENIFKKDIRNTDDFNVIARVIIHEITHQWWGYLLTPKRVEGAMVLGESLAKYSETVLMEKLYGKAMVKQLSEYTIRRYFTGRSHATEKEPPLYLSKQQQYLGYSKGAIVMSAIKDLIGETTLNIVLSNLITKYHQAPTATTLDFLEELYTVVPKEHHTLIDDWIKRVITYDLKITSTSYKKLSNGKYEITINIHAHRYQTSKTGKETKININEPITIGLFKKHPKTINHQNEILHLKEHQINNSKMEFKIITKEIPLYITIDPYHTRLDRNLADNIISM